jgi:hypothetical protein
MPRWGDEKVRLRKLLAAPISDEEPCTRMFFPRHEAKKRIKEKRHRVGFACDEITYRAFNEERERVIRQLDDNPTFFGVFLTDVLKGFTNELVAQWRTMHEGPKEPEHQRENLAKGAEK